MQKDSVPFRNKQEWIPVYSIINKIMELLGEERNNADVGSVALGNLFEYFIAIILVFLMKNTS
jgi:hypothetical protein